MAFIRLRRSARYYDSELGRWLQVDPLAEKHPDWNPYNYCLNNPLRYFDPNGKTEEERQKAVAASNDRLGTSYAREDCSAHVNAVVKSVMGKSLNTGNLNGVGNIASNSRKVNSNEMREGDLVTFRTNRKDHKGPNGEFDHIGIVTGGIVKNENGEIASFSFNHASSGKGMAIPSVWEGDKSWRTLTGVYQWDTQIEPVYQAELPVIEIIGKTVATEMRESFSKSVFERE